MMTSTPAPFYTSAHAEPLLDDAILDELADLNASFLELLLDMLKFAPPEQTTLLGLSRAHLTAIENLKVTQFKALCRCPYALFDVRLDDKRIWDNLSQGFLLPELLQHQEACQIPLEWLDKHHAFTLSALHYARHLVLAGVSSAKLVLDMADGNARNLVGLPISRLSHLARQGKGLLSAKFANNPLFWFNLIKTARSNNTQALNMARLSGLHMMSEAPISA